MTILGLDHVQIAIPAGGEAQARRFYGQILGMREIAKPDSLSPQGCWFVAGTAHVHIANVHIGIDPDFVPARTAHPALLVDDLAALEARLQAAGHAVEPGKPVPLHHRFFTHDPFGNRIECMQCEPD